VRAGSVTLRIDDLLVGIACDAVGTLQRCRRTFAPWVDDSQPNITPAFDLRLARTATDAAGVRSVPQLRLGASVAARSRSVGDVVSALDSILGGVRAHRSSPERTWTVMRPFVRGQRAVLLDARSPTLVNDPLLARAGIVELPTWVVAVTEPDGDGPVVLEVPAPLAAPGADQRYELLGVVAVDATAGADTAGAVLARCGARHTSPAWFRTVTDLLDHDRFVTTADRVAARRAIGDLLGASV
jgi:hypothetical protein